MADDEIKYIDIKEFCELGFLQEANRLFFHPLGLALEVTVEEDGTEHLSGVWDYREDSEGMVYDDGEIDRDKIQRVNDERSRHVKARIAMMGRIVQGPETTLRPAEAS